MRLGGAARILLGVAAGHRLFADLLAALFSRRRSVLPRVSRGGMASGCVVLPAGCWFLAGSVVPLWLQRRWPLSNPGVGLATGVVLILPAWLALVQLRQAGSLALLAIMAVVWLADIGAYFTGRRFGKHKLAPKHQPGQDLGRCVGGGVDGSDLRVFPVLEAAGDAV
jgi:CDP-diglyceride synthetase